MKTASSLSLAPASFLRMGFDTCPAPHALLIPLRIHPAPQDGVRTTGLLHSPGTHALPPALYPFNTLAQTAVLSSCAAYYCIFSGITALETRNSPLCRHASCARATSPACRRQHRQKQTLAVPRQACALPPAVRQVSGAGTGKLKDFPHLTVLLAPLPAMYVMSN